MTGHEPDAPMSGPHDRERSDRPPASSRPPKRSSKGLIIALIAVVVLGGLGAGSYFLFFAKDPSPAEVLTNFLEMDFSVDTAMVNPLVCAGDPNNVRGENRTVEKHLGQTVIWSNVTELNVGPNAAEVTADLRMSGPPGRPMNPPTTVTFRLVKESGDWKVCGKFEWSLEVVDDFLQASFKDRDLAAVNSLVCANDPNGVKVRQKKLIDKLAGVNVGWGPSPGMTIPSVDATTAELSYDLLLPMSGPGFAFQTMTVIFKLVKQTDQWESGDWRICDSQTPPASVVRSFLEQFKNLAGNNPGVVADTAVINDLVCAEDPNDLKVEQTDLDKITEVLITWSRIVERGVGASSAEVTFELSLLGVILNPDPQSVDKTTTVTFKLVKEADDWKICEATGWD